MSDNALSSGPLSDGNVTVADRVDAACACKDLLHILSELAEVNSDREARILIDVAENVAHRVLGELRRPEGINRAETATHLAAITDDNALPRDWRIAFVRLYIGRIAAHLGIAAPERAAQALQAWRDKRGDHDAWTAYVATVQDRTAAIAISATAP